MMRHIRNNSRQSYRTPTRNKSTPKAAKNTMTLISSKVFAITFVLVLLAGIGFKIYKADYTGIVYDESFSLANFGKSTHAALTSYINPNNNHILNSILICFAHKHFSSYEHFIRIHSVLFGILFSLSVAYIIHKTIESKILKIIVLGLVLFNWFVFDLSFLARGYSIALGAIYAGIAIILGLLSKKIKYTYRWVPIIIVVLMNFFAFGSMLSCIFVLFSVNAIFILFYSSSVFRDAPNRRNPVLLNLISISSFTFVLLYLLYINIYKDIWNVRDKFATTISFRSHMKLLLVDSMIVEEGNIFTVIVYSVFVFLVGLSVLFGIYQFCLKAKNGTWRLHLRSDDLGVFIYLATAIAISVMFIHRVLLNMSLGYMRNGVFLVPLVLISAGVLLDRFWKNIKNKGFLSPVVRGCIVVVTILLTLRNLPSAYAIEVYNWDRQSISGPLLHRLRDANPDKIWKIRLSKEARHLTWPLFYYTQFGYKFQIVRSRDWDIGILYKTEKLTKAIYLDKDYFSKFNCYVVVNPRKAVSLGP